jgi:hypothetical protein
VGSGDGVGVGRELGFRVAMTAATELSSTSAVTLKSVLKADSNAGSAKAVVARVLTWSVVRPLS